MLSVIEMKTKLDIQQRQETIIVNYKMGFKSLNSIYEVDLSLNYNQNKTLNEIEKRKKLEETKFFLEKTNEKIMGTPSNRSSISLLKKFVQNRKEILELEEKIKKIENTNFKEKTEFNASNLVLRVFKSLDEGLKELHNEQTQTPMNYNLIIKGLKNKDDSKNQEIINKHIKDKLTVLIKEKAENVFQNCTFENHLFSF